MGYDENFIGANFRVPMPRLTAEISSAALIGEGVRDLYYLDYKHYTVVMNRTTRQPMFTALNVDQNLFRKTKSKGYWKIDSRAGRENQLNNDYYRKNDWDKGHMVMRWNTAWGESDYEAQIADDESYYYTNAALQHQNLNRDEWFALEEKVVRSFSEDLNNKLCVFTGPIHGELDRHYERGWHDSVRIPSAFFKIICYQPKNESNDKKVGVKAFVIHQDEEMIKDQKGAAKIKFANYQETITTIEQMTGLDFGRELFDANPLQYYETEEKQESLNISAFPESRLITQDEDIIDGGKRAYTMESQNTRCLAIVSAMIDPKGNERRSEWINILNRSSRSVNLSGWKLTDDANALVELSGKLAPGASKVIKGKSLGKIVLRNSGGAIKLFDGSPCLVDHVVWSKHDVDRSNNRALVFA